MIASSSFNKCEGSTGNHSQLNTRRSASTATLKYVCRLPRGPHCLQMQCGGEQVSSNIGASVTATTILSIRRHCWWSAAEAAAFRVLLARALTASEGKQTMMNARSHYNPHRSYISFKWRGPKECAKWAGAVASGARRHCERTNTNQFANMETFRLFTLYARAQANPYTYTTHTII